MTEAKPVVGIIMGSNSDWPTMKAAARVLEEFGVPFEASVVSAHRTPDLMFDYAESARERGWLSWMRASPIPNTSPMHTSCSVMPRVLMFSPSTPGPSRLAHCGHSCASSA